jgi:pseudouridine-5'-phosphate glycosidase
VAAALVAGGPVVALESTIISHGMPYPDNVQCARDVEAIVRANGAVPATVAIMDGRIRVGLDDAGGWARPAGRGGVWGWEAFTIVL